ncbi:MAG: glycosyltransferase family 4 protein [Bacteroidota bacterium]
MERGTPRLLFIKILNNSFVAKDEAVLREAFSVRTFAFGFKKGGAHLLRQFQLLAWLFRNLWWADQVFIWFADYHAFFPSMLGRLLGKRVSIVIGGFDAIKRPDLNYGGHNSAIRSQVIRWSCRWATHLLPVSAWTMQHLEQTTRLSLAQKGRVLFNGVDDPLFLPLSTTDQDRKGVVCVASVKDLRTVRVKGLDLVKDLARHFPDQPFCIAGVRGPALEALKQDAPANLELIDWVEREELQALYSRFQVVCQFSRSESFGLALAEGMLSGCVGASVADLGTAEIIDESSGFLAPNREEAELITVLRKSLAASQPMRDAAQKRIQAHFMLSQRSAQLLALIRSDAP